MNLQQNQIERSVLAAIQSTMPRMPAKSAGECGVLFFGLLDWHCRLCPWYEKRGIERR
jgi:hypothetical protein